jgi:ketosteroid isomerase-like protein
MDAHQMALDEFAALSTGDVGLAAACIHPDSVNHMATEEPPACARRGVPGAMATGAWLRRAFADLHYELLDLVSDEERSVAHVRMSGRQTGPFVVFPPGGRPVSFPPTGREFAVRQCHVWRLGDGLHLDHVAVRDDLGMMTQLGHVPPSPAAMLRMVRWQVSGGHRGAVQEAIAVAEKAADAAEAHQVA